MNANAPEQLLLDEKDITNRNKGKLVEPDIFSIIVSQMLGYQFLRFSNSINFKGSFFQNAQNFVAGN